MTEQKASREGAVIKLPKYVNAEMLMLEFFKGRAVVIEPLTPTVLYTKMELSYTDGRISDKEWRKLVDYINFNI